MTQRGSILQCDHGQRRHAIVQSILTEVFEGRIHAGQHLVTEDLAKLFGVSHTPIREALIELAAIGMIDLLPNRGAIVRHVTVQEVLEISQVRGILECEATRSACGRCNPAELKSLRSELQQLIDQPARPANEFVAQARTIDTRLHDLVTASCGNRFLAREINRLKTLFRVFRDVSYTQDGVRNDFQRLSAETHEHLAIVDALERGDVEAAVLSMQRHISSGATHWTRIFPALEVQR